MLARTRIKDIVFKIPFLKKYYTAKRAKSGDLIADSEVEVYLNSANVVLSNLALSKEIKVGIVADGDEYKGYSKVRSYYPKFQRYLNNNNIEWEYYDILSHDWIEKAKGFDVIVWHTDSNPSTQEIAANKIYTLDKIMKLKCFPSFDEIWTYEDKINMHYMYTIHNLPQIPTYVTHNKEDALEYVKNARFPLISKLVTGSASFGVEKINNMMQAKSLIDKSFSYKGKATYFPYQRQKDYVLFQEFIEGATFDLRVMVVGDKLFGYYRYPKNGDFRASGAGIVEKKAIDIKALDLAFKVKEHFQTTFLATDLLFSSKDNCYYIIESSIFIGVDTARQLEIGGKAGYYKRISEGVYEFVEGEYWVQELMLESFIEKIK